MKLKNLTPEQMDVIIRSGSPDKVIALKAQKELAISAQGDIRDGILEGDMISEIYTSVDFAPGSPTEFPLDIMVPGEDRDFSAYTIPNHGRIPERSFEGDTVNINTYDVGSSIDWLLKFARNSRYDVIGKALAILEATFLRKMNLDGWQTILAAATDRNVIVFDADAPSGFFTKRLISLMQLAMRRQGGGNSATLSPITLTDVFVSPEGLEDMRSWTLSEVDDNTRNRIFNTPTNGLAEMFGVRLHELFELGQGQAFQDYFTQLGGVLNGSDQELVIGLDLSQEGVFMNPVRAPIEIFEDETLHRQRRAGYYGWGEHGFGVLDNRRLILGSF